MSPSAWAFNRRTVGVLWRRDLRRFCRQPMRLAAALGQPLLFWWLLGSGMAQSLRLPGSPVAAMEYFFPGVVLLVTLLAATLASVNLIEDRHQGFLQGVLAGPGSSGALAWGKCLGAATVACAQSALFVALAPFAGFSFAEIDWPLLALVLASSALLLSGLGFATAWALDNVQAYQAVQMTLLVPLWLLSGAMFPARASAGALHVGMALNPLAYALAGLRHALYGGTPPAALMPPLWSGHWLAVLALAAWAAMALAVAACRRR